MVMPPAVIDALCSIEDPRLGHVLHSVTVMYQEMVTTLANGP